MGFFLSFLLCHLLMLQVINNQHHVNVFLTRKALLFDKNMPYSVTIVQFSNYEVTI